MHVPRFIEGFVSLKNLTEHGTRFLLGDFAFLLHYLGEISSWAVLSNDVAIVSCEEWVVVVQDIGMFDLFEAFDLCVEHNPGSLVFERFEFDDFDGYFLSCEVIEALIDCGWVSFADAISKEKGVVLYLFAHLSPRVGGQLGHGLLESLREMGVC